MTAPGPGHPQTPLGAPRPVGSERRRTERIRAGIRATVRGAGAADAPGEGSPTRARAVDISEFGARLVLRRRMPVGQRVELDLECELPLRLHLGYGVDSLVIDGPMHTHLVRIEATVVRSELMSDRLWEIGVEFCPRSAWDERQAVQLYVDHLRETDTWVN